MQFRFLGDQRVQKISLVIHCNPMHALRVKHNFVGNNYATL